MYDIKLQAYRGASGPNDVDFRKSTGGYKGSPEDEHRTVAERRVDETGLAAALEAAKVVNQQFAELLGGHGGGSLASVAGLLGLGGSGPVKLAIRVYDAD